MAERSPCFGSHPEKTTPDDEGIGVVMTIEVN
jgi:hypothetical protein